jgi:AAA domain
MRILSFLAENFMRLTVVQITPDGNLIQITGANGEGKTSTINALWAALGGSDAIPDQPIHAGKKSARIEVKLGDDDGTKLIVERSFTEKGSYLTVKSPDGGKFSKPQKIMDGLMGAIGFDPLAFMRMNAKEQFDMLRNIVPLAVDVDALDRKRLTIYEARTALNRTIAAARARAEAIKFPDDLPDEAPDREAIMNRLANVSTHNATVSEYLRDRERLHKARNDYLEDVLRIQEELDQAKRDLAKIETEVAQADAQIIPDPIDAADVRAELEAAERVIEGQRLRQSWIDADGELTTLTREETEKNEAIAVIDAEKTKAITSAKMPVEGLSFRVPEGEAFSKGVVEYNGHPLRQASAAEQLAVSAAIGAALNPQLKVLLCRDGSLLDSKSLAALGTFAEKAGMQVFLERVDESGEVGVVIEDGHVKGQEALVEAFLKEEAEGPQAASKGEKTADAPAPDPERSLRATAYLAAEIEKLTTYATAKECDKANAQVKHMLRAFPELIVLQWNSAYLERVAVLTRKK